MEKVRPLAEGNLFVFLIQHGYHYETSDKKVKEPRLNSAALSHLMR